MDDSGTVIRRTKGYYFLLTATGQEIECKVKGKLFQKSRFANQIAVGDRVKYTKVDSQEHGLIYQILPRKSFLSRTRVGIEAEQVIAANVDNLLIISSCKNPTLRPNLINRMVVAAKIGSVEPILVITKTDLISEKELKTLQEPFIQMGLAVFYSSIVTGFDQAQILALLTNKITVLAGQSGVGKSSLLNQLFPDLKLRIGSISEKTLKGAHTTTHVSMHKIMADSYVMDTPGIRMFGLWNVTRENLNRYYPLIDGYYNHCHFRECLHISEPGCAVKEATQKGDIPKNVYTGYLSLCQSFLEP